MNARINPYVGPRAFETGERLYGRERELRQLQSLLIAERLVLLHSPSGAGKTSLIQAGLVPALREREFNVLPAVRVNLEPPSDLALPESFNRYLFSVLVSLEEPLRPHERLQLDELLEISLEAYLRQRPRRPDDPPSDLLVFDQFEEILTNAPADREGKLAFFNQLGEALRNPDRWALFVMREDYLGALSPYLRPIPGQLEQRYRLDLLGPEAALQAIQNPARNSGVDFTDAAAELLVTDLCQMKVQQPDGSFHSVAGPQIEPVQLQVACYNLWQSGAANDMRISRGDVRRIGAVDQALSQYYASSVSKASEISEVEERLIRQWFNEQLITTEGIRSQVLKGQEVTEGLPNRVLIQLENAHLIRGNTHAGKIWYELAHDRLVEPIKRENAVWFDANLSLLQKQTALWVQQKRPDGLLLRSKLLYESEIWAKNNRLEPDEEALLFASRKLHRQEQLLRRFIGSIVFLFVISVIALLFSFWAFRQSEARRVTALGQAALAENEPHQAVILALQAQKLSNVNEARNLLVDSTAEIDLIGKNQVLLGHWGSVNSAAWSPDGHLASGSYDNTIIIWDLASGQPAQILKGHSSSVISVAWSPDGRLASGSKDGTIIIWNLASSQPAQILKGHSDSVSSVAWSPDGHLASGSYDKTIIIWDLASGQPAQILKGHTYSISSVAWSPDGHLASGSDDNTVIIWDLASGQPAQILKGHSELVSSVAWSPDGRLASGSSDKTIIIWDLASGQPAQILKGHSSSVISVAWSPDGRLASGSYDKTIIIWDLANGQPAQILKGHSDWVSSVAWSPDGRLASGSDDNTVIIWDLASCQPVQILKGHSDWVSSVAWSPDGHLASGSYDKTIIIWDLASGQPAQILKGYSELVSSVAWSPDGHLASGSDDGTITLWDLASGQPAQILKGHSDWVSSIAWSPDGRLASGSNDGTIIIWDLARGQPAQILKGHSYSVSSVAWSPDGRLASGSHDGTIIIWDLASGQPAQILKGHSEFVSSVAWSPDGRLASGSHDGTIIIWDLASSQPAQILKGYSGSVSSVAWSLDGSLASGSWDGKIIIWGLAVSQPAQILKGHSEFVSSVAWSPDGRLASGSYDKTIRVVAKRFTDSPCNWVLRNLTATEWANILGILYIYDPACPNLPTYPIPVPSKAEWIESFHQFGIFRDIFAYLFSPYSIPMNDSVFSTGAFLFVTWPGRLVLLLIVFFAITMVVLLLRLAFKGILSGIKYLPVPWNKVRTKPR